MLLTNTDNKRQFTITNDKLSYLIKFLRARPDSYCESTFIDDRKFINTIEANRFVDTIKHMLTNYEVYDFNVNGLVVPIFNPLDSQLNDPQYSVTKLKIGNSHFLDCLIDFLSKSKLTRIDK